MTTNPESSSFVFACCQAGAENVLKSHVLEECPTWRLAFSRRGFVTFKVPEEVDKAPLLRSAFARTFGLSIGQVAAGEFSEVKNLIGTQKYHHLHVWPRDHLLPGDRGWMPGPTDTTNQIGQQIVDALSSGSSSQGRMQVNRQAKTGQRVLDCIVVGPDQWWLGKHVVGCFGQQWPGGVVPVRAPEEMVSRAYLKMHEALMWSGIPIEKGDQCVEIGSAPGGACQRLLESDLHVTGIDPSKMADVVLQHPKFTHIKKRGSDVRRKEYRDFKWLFADSNVAPKHTLDTVESIVTHDTNRIRGVVLTLKLLQPELKDELGSYLERIRSWGFEYVRCRQLAFQRQEVCVAAMKSRSMRRPRRQRVVRSRKPGQAKGAEE